VPDELPEQGFDHCDRASAVLAGITAARIREDREELRIDAAALEPSEIRVRPQRGAGWRRQESA